MTPIWLDARGRQRLPTRLCAQCGRDIPAWRIQGRHLSTAVRTWRPFPVEPSVNRCGHSETCVLEPTRVWDPTLRVLERLAKALRVPVTALLE